MRIIFSYFVIALFLLGGCKKYAEGGKVGGLTGTAQRIAGDYEIISFTVNGNDSLAALTSHPGYCAGLKIEFERNQGESNIVKPSCGMSPLNSWRATDDRKQIEITCTSTVGATSLSVILSNQNLMLPWDIQKLTKKEFWITTSYNNNSYYLKMKR